MSVYKHKESPFYHFDFQYKGRRFYGSTEARTKREAEAVERAEREKAKQSAKTINSLSVRLDDVAGRYFVEVGQHHVGSATTFRDVERLIRYFGPDKLLTEITDSDVANMVSWRRGHSIKDHRKKRPKNAPPLPKVSNSTVNRSTTEVLKKIFTRAKAWGIRFDREPEWCRHILKEPQERVRELQGDEPDRLDEATREDYRPIVEFALASGLRLSENLLKWSQVNWETKRIERLGKGGKRVVVPITSEIRAILWPLRGHHEEMVFTYVAARTRKAMRLVKGHRYPITYNGLKSAWKRIRTAANMQDFRFHDLRHDFGSKLLRSSRNLKLVQRAMNHSDIKTTLRYAHVLDDEIAGDIEAMQKSRRKSRTKVRKAG